jgi:hypothetical protein
LTNRPLFFSGADDGSDQEGGAVFFIGQPGQRAFGLPVRAEVCGQGPGPLGGCGQQVGLMQPGPGLGAEGQIAGFGLQHSVRCLFGKKAGVSIDERDADADQRNDGDSRQQNKAGLLAGSIHNRFPSEVLRKTD